MSIEMLAVLEKVGYFVGSGCALGAGEGVICRWGGIGSNEFCRCSVFFYWVPNLIIIILPDVLWGAKLLALKLCSVGIGCSVDDVTPLDLHAG